ncbi:MAG TPA: choice-of-anchor tandem repeat GloVer-containing protein [Thermoanaerobaculia bacterium]|nr:choice-of-anchor tandem repeat GloVer-containing protein [Thermoanaerobaculia bacterium]
MNKMIIFRERRPRPGRLGRWDFCGLGIGFLVLGSLSVPAKAQTFEVVTSFTVPASVPVAGVVQASDGFFYGTTRGGGATNGGTVFKIDSAGNLTTLHTFSYENGIVPEAGLLLATDGKFYGTTFYGGAYDFGTVFRIDSAGNLTVLHSFAGPGSVGDGSSPASALIQGSDGNFYGTTTAGGLAYSDLGTVFKMTPAGDVTILHSFAGGADGYSPFAALVQSAADGKLYGTTPFEGSGGGGTVFRLSTDGMNFQTLHGFSAATDGAGPSAALVAANGKFYGTTREGTGTNQYGNVFSIDSSGAFAVVKSFGASDGHGPLASLILATDGKLYGTTNLGGANDRGTVFKIDFAGNLTTLHSFAGADGANPVANVLQGTDGNFYGTTSAGGANDRGTVFKMTPAGAITTLENFGDPSTGYEPDASVVQASDGNLYGTTFWGGPGNFGTIFKLTLAGTRTVFHNFTGDDGSQPWAQLVQASDGKLYGTGSRGGASGWGTAFSLTLGGTYSLLHSFGGADGVGPRDSALVQRAADGMLYGLTEGGGSGYGNAYKMTTSGGVTSLHSFNITDGALPSDGLLLASDGNFYGTTSAGGSGTNWNGTVFKMTPAGTVTTLHSFNHAPGADDDGGAPMGGLIQASDGKFYGTTRVGGANTEGNIYRIDSAGNYATIYSFSGSDGSEPYGNLLQLPDGKLYGTTRTGGPSGAGTIFSVDTTGANFTTLHAFTIEDGAGPVGTLIKASDGKLYGTTSGGGPGKSGVVFRVTLSTCTAPPAPTAGNNGPICAGSTLQLTATTVAGATYAWTGPNGFTSTAQNPSIANATTAASGTYTVHAIVGGCSSAAATTTATVNAIPAAPTAGNNGPICAGSTLQLTATTVSGATYAWAGPNGFTSTLQNPSIANATTAATGTYTVHAIVGSCSSAAATTTATVSAKPSAPTASNNGPICAGQDLHLTASTIAGATYSWTGPNGFTSSVQNPVITAATTAASGTYSVVAIVGGCASAPATTTATVRAGPSAVITTAGAVCPNSSGHPASVPDAGAGAAYAWSITNGTITAGAGTRSITFSTGSMGPLGLSVTVTNASGCSANSSVSIPFSGCLSFYTLAPCRVIDTRGPAGPLGGPALAAKATRTFAVAGHCGIPSTAKALSVNVTVTQSTGAGDLRLFAGGASLPLVSTINYGTGQTRANNAVTSLGATGLAIRCDQASGTVQAIVDVNGYFQ